MTVVSDLAFCRLFAKYRHGVPGSDDKWSHLMIPGNSAKKKSTVFVGKRKDGNCGLRLIYEIMETPHVTTGGSNSVR